MSEAAKPSPLAEAKMDSIRELMSRDPLDLTRQDRDGIVKILREARLKFAEEDAKPKASKRSKLEPVTGKVDLDDLGL